MTAQTETAAMNAQSVLFRLPAELRLQIFEHVVGRAIHHVAHSSEGSLEVTLCLDQVLGTDYGNKEYEDLRACHDLCQASIWPRVVTEPPQAKPFPAVCRQMHVEASLLPFKPNHFTFTHVGAVDALLQVLSREQNAAVEEVGFTQANANLGLAGEWRVVVAHFLRRKAGVDPR